MRHSERKACECGLSGVVKYLLRLPVRSGGLQIFFERIPLPMPAGAESDEMNQVNY